MKWGGAELSRLHGSLEVLFCAFGLLTCPHGKVVCGISLIGGEPQVALVPHASPAEQRPWSINGLFIPQEPLSCHSCSGTIELVPHSIYHAAVMRISGGASTTVYRQYLG